MQPNAVKSHAKMEELAYVMEHAHVVMNIMDYSVNVSRN